jgi:hypothetical protein
MTTATPTWTYPRENVRRVIADVREDRAKGTGAADPAAYAAHVKDAIARRALPEIRPDTVRVGQAATFCLWTDSHACEVVAVSPSGRKVTVREMKATIDPAFKPEFIPGGFVGHVPNQDDQRWTLESDPAGATHVAHWSDKRKRYEVGGRGGCRVYVHAAGEGHEFHDYNF